MANKTMHHLVIEDNNYEIFDQKARQMVASEYDASETYHIGDLVVYDGKLLRCTAEITTPEAYNLNHWTYFTVKDALDNIEQGNVITSCDTAENDLNKTAMIFNYDRPNYAPKWFGIVAIRFVNAVKANSTLNINNTGARAIYKGTSPITDGVIKAGDTALFMLNGIGRYVFLGTDTYGEKIDSLTTDVNTLKEDLGKGKNLYNGDLEQGGMDANGLNAPGSEQGRCRTKGFIEVEEGATYSVSYNYTASSNNSAVVVNFYVDNQYTTKRSAVVGWIISRQTTFTVPSGCHYIRLLFLVQEETTISRLAFENIQVEKSTYQTQFEKPLADLTNYVNENFGITSLNIERGGFDGQGFDISSNERARTIGHIPVIPFTIYTVETEYSGFQFGVSFYTNTTDARLSYTSWLNVGEEFTVPYNCNYIRIIFKRTNGGSFNEHAYSDTGYVLLKASVINRSSYDSDHVEYVSGVSNLNDFVKFGVYSLTGVIHDNEPAPAGANKILEVMPYPNGAIFQRITYTTMNRVYHRLKASGGGWLDWHSTGGAFATIKYYFPQVGELNFNYYSKRDKTVQGCNDIALYNGTFFGFDEGHMYVNDTAISITNGHGNNCMFGKTLHGDYPYLYCGSWLKDTCKVYINQVTNDSATLVKTINYPTLSGYLNACVDEPNSRIYILLNVSETTYEGVIHFIVSDMDGNILSETPINRIPVVQGMTFYNGKIYVTSGDGIDYPNTLTILDTSGNIVSQSDNIVMGGEIEGIDFYNGCLYIATQTAIYHN